MIDAAVVVDKASGVLMAEFHELVIDGWRDDSQLSLTSKDMRVISRGWSPSSQTRWGVL
jgi:hypothetical protein